MATAAAAGGRGAHARRPTTRHRRGSGCAATARSPPTPPTPTTPVTAGEIPTRDAVSGLEFPVRGVRGADALEEWIEAAGVAGRKRRLLASPEHRGEQRVDAVDDRVQVVAALEHPDDAALRALVRQVDERAG